MGSIPLSSTRTWLRLGTIATSVVAACQFTHGELPRDAGSGSDAPPPPDAGTCAGASRECIGDVLRTCDMAGGSAVDIPCSWGCIASPAHCAQLVPSGSGGMAGSGVMPDDIDATGLADVTLGNITIDSDTGRIGTNANPSLHHGAMPGIENGIDFQVRGPIAMFRFKSLMLGGTITLVGKRPIALVADGPVAIGGVIDARGLCSGSVAGPGGFDGGSTQGSAGGAPSATMGGGSGATASSGGGGGGHGAQGGSGKDAAGGSAYGDPAITTLVGGAGGGAGGGGGNFGKGGGGGGALQIVSNTGITIAGSGGINAGGCGGKPGTGNSDSGGGGGAGGAILLEAPTVTVAGALAANGGGGGGGGGGNASPGESGRLDRMPAAGGSGQATDEAGGSGGVGGMAAQAGASGSNPGGGGGAIGRIRINTRNDAGAMLTGATLSPGPNDPENAFSTGSAATQ
jgi:hypothetical protein